MEVGFFEEKSLPLNGFHKGGKADYTLLVASRLVIFFPIWFMC